MAHQVHQNQQGPDRGSIPAPAASPCVPAWTAIWTPGRIHNELKGHSLPVLFSPRPPGSSKQNIQPSAWVLGLILSSSLWLDLMVSFSWALPPDYPWSLDSPYPFPLCGWPLVLLLQRDAHSSLGGAPLNHGYISACLPACACVHTRSVTKSCPTLCIPVDCSPPGSSVHGIFQARILE